MTLAPDRVCVVIGRTRHKMMQAELQESVRRGAKFVEVRLDFLAKAVDFQRLSPFKQCPWVATLRRPIDGGRWSGTEAERQIVMRQAIVSGLFDWVDLEHDVAGAIRRYGPVKRVVSYHNLAATPPDLEEIYKRMLDLDGDVYKLAVNTQTLDDVARVLALQRSAPKPTIAFGMGELGFPTRLLSLKFGAPWTYAGFNKDRSLAPGLPTTDDFRTTYPVRGINAETEVFGLLGDPVAQSYSPVLHNHMLGRMNRNALYLPFRVPAGQLAEALKVFDAVPVSGYSVTIPHKEDAAKLATSAEPAATRCGAANTLTRRRDGGWFAANTDAHAALESLGHHLATRPPEADAPADAPPAELTKQFVLLLGAGGTARALAFALQQEGVALTISARGHERAAKLAAEVGCKVAEWAGRHNVLPCDVVINCTPVGMAPDTDATPVHASFLKPGLTVFDAVYSPENTLLIREARARGCHVITGVDMFVRQAARQLELFTGRTPDLEKMRGILRKAMSPLTRALDDEAREAMPSESGE